MMKKLACAVILLAVFAGASWAGGQRRISVVIFPTINSTGLEIWESKYYPYNVLEQKMSEYFEWHSRTATSIWSKIYAGNHAGISYYL